MKTTSTISKMVTEDYRAASVLDRFGIDFCESGQQTLSEVCNTLHIDENTLENALSGMNSSSTHHNPHWNFEHWDTRFLVEFIVHAHHHYLRATLPELLRLGERVLIDARSGVTDLLEIYRLLQRFSEDLMKHLDVEERKVFPYILDLETARTAHIALVAPEFGRLDNPVRQMMQQHEHAIQFLQDIRKKTQQLKKPAQASDEFRSWFTLLEEFDANMHLFIHLETNILFPRALAAETELLERIGFTTIWFG